MTFGDWLRIRRKATGLSQEALAKAADNVCTGSYISNLERNADVGKNGQPNRPSEEVVEKLAQALRVPLNEARDMAGYAPVGQLQRPEGERLLKYFNALPDNVRLDVMAIVQTLYSRYVSVADIQELGPQVKYTLAEVKALEKK